jgi:hypothetical protein
MILFYMVSSLANGLVGNLLLFKIVKLLEAKNRLEFEPKQAPEDPKAT